MSFEPQSLFSLPASSLFLIALGLLLVGACVYLGISLRRSGSPPNADLERLRRDAELEAKEITERSSNEAARIVEDAEKRALELLRRVEFAGSVTEDIGQKFDAVLREFLKTEGERLAKTSDEFLGAYRTLASSAEQVYTKTLEYSSHTMTENAREAMLEFQKTLKEELDRYEVGADERIREWREFAKQDIERYKKETFSRIDDAVYRIMLFVAKRVLGKAIDLQDHQELVIKALDEAKKEGLFRS